MYNGVGIYFEILGEITEIELIATGHGIGVLKFLRKRYGAGQWRKLKGIARVRKRSGSIPWPVAITAISMISPRISKYIPTPLSIGV